MLNIGIVIAASVMVIYIILGPLVILGIYAFFDRMAENAENEYESGVHKIAPQEDKDPALWSEQDVRKHFERQRRFRTKDRNGDSDRL